MDSSNKFSSRWELVQDREGNPLGVVPIWCYKEKNFLESQLQSKNPNSILLESSGSTEDSKAMHWVDAEAWKHSLDASAHVFSSLLETISTQETLWTCISYVPSPYEWPTSSLAHMIGAFSSCINVKLIYLTPTLESLKSTYQKEKNKNIIIFGTSYHHLSLFNEFSDFKSGEAPNWDRLIVIDTGGTKGRTVWIPPEDLQLKLESLYSKLTKQIHFWSEYGMCELLSQAWNTTQKLGNFTCAPSLQVAAVKRSNGQPTAEKDSIHPNWVLADEGEPGLLLFWDAFRPTSGAYLLTEDWGSVSHPNRAGWSKEFQLLGRAPDASVKGCSLRVTDHFVWKPPSNIDSYVRLNETSTPHPVFKNPKSLSLPHFLDGIQSEKDLWLPREIQWLQSLFGEQAHLLPQTLHRVKPGSHLGIVASANIPIVTLAPVLWALALGFEKISVKLPSLRAMDPLSLRIFRQQKAILKVLQLHYKALEWSHEDLSMFPHGANPIFVFGTDQTIHLFKKHAPGSRIKGFGPILNGQSASVVENQSLSEQAQQLSTWWGRGCLTPLWLEIPPHWTQEKQSSFGRELAQALSDEMQVLFEVLNVTPRAYFDLRTLKLRHFLKQNKAHGSLWVEKAGVVADLSYFGEMSNPASGPWESILGQGMVALFRSGEYPNLFNSVSQNTLVLPDLYAPHMGKTWEQWLTHDSQFEAKDGE
jgi:hypothetical protein